MARGTVLQVAVLVVMVFGVLGAKAPRCDITDEHMRAFFRAIDFDKNGGVSQYEVGEAFLKAEKQGKRSLDRREFVAGFTKYTSVSSVKVPADSVGGIFDLLDDDNDNLLTTMELQTDFILADSNGDGQIDNTELSDLLNMLKQLCQIWNGDGPLPN